jgi:hypothetical protein
MESSLKISARLHQVEEQVQEFKQRVNKNSSNSNKPSSSNGFIKPQSRRKKSGKKPGGQMGREGKTLEMTPNPDKIEIHQVSECANCNRNFQGVKIKQKETRQVYDIPLPQKLTATEHQCELVICPDCGTENRAAFPKEHNLLDRLSENKREALAFLYEHRVNFDNNNMVEKVIRMVKVKQKISCVFCSEHGAKMFCCIRGYISMVRKNSLPVLEVLSAALHGRPYLPQQ